MEQNKSHSNARRQRTLRLSAYEDKLVITNAKKSGFTTVAEYLRGLICTDAVRKPVK